MTGADPQKILVIRLSSIGDVLLTTPLLRLLRRRFKTARIDFIVKAQYADLLRTNKHISHLLLFNPQRKKELSRLRAEIRKTGYDLILDIHKNLRSLYLSGFLSKSLLIRYEKFYWKRLLLIRFGWNLYSQPIPVHQRYLKTAERWHIYDDGLGLDLTLDDAVAAPVIAGINTFAAGRPLIGMAPSAAFANKRWPWEYFAELAQNLQQTMHAGIVLIGNAQDRSIIDRIAERLIQAPLNLAGKSTLMQTAAAISRCKLFITNDTGPMHMAGALKIPTLAIFGPTTRELGFFPLEKHSRVIEMSDLSCRPCTHMGRNHCPKKHFRCMKDISPELVFSAAVEILTNYQKNN